LEILAYLKETACQNSERIRKYIKAKLVCSLSQAYIQSSCKFRYIKLKNQKMNIILAEDEIITALDISQRLKEEFDAEVYTTTRGKGIISLATKYKPDIVISDIKLKDEISGIDAIKELKLKYNIPVIFITAYTITFYMEQISKMTNVFVLPKPLNFTLFSSIVKSLIK